MQKNIQKEKQSRSTETTLSPNTSRKAGFFRCFSRCKGWLYLLPAMLFLGFFMVYP